MLQHGVIAQRGRKASKLNFVPITEYLIQFLLFLPARRLSEQSGIVDFGNR